MRFSTAKLGDVTSVSWGNTSITKASYSEEGYTAFSATGPDGRLPGYEHDGPGIVLSAIGARCGRCFPANGRWTAIKNTITITPNQKDGVDFRFLLHFVNRDNVWPSRGGGQPFIGLGTARDLEIPLPPLPEQKRIADILDKADAIRRKRQQVCHLVREILTSAYVELFGNPRHNVKSWSVTALGDVCAVDRGKFTPRPRNDPKYFGGLFPFIQTGDITLSGGLLSKWKQTLNHKGVAVSRSFRPGTVLIAIVGATIGETAILTREMYCPDSVIGITPKTDRATSEYVEFTLRFFKQHFRDMAPETARANINLETIRPLVIPIPPLNLQQKFTSTFRKCYAIKQKLGEHEDEANHLFHSLVQQAFQGRL